jgi:NAD(P)-dependent dehydrogenase (short-subunit alcohol dehydrogenase family)
MNIIITGGSGGIGREIVMQMSGNRDNQIIVSGRNEDALKEIVAACENGNVSYLKQDLSEDANIIEATKEQIFNRFSRIDILINCAGALVVRDFMKISGREARMMMETNFFGPASLIRILVPMMSEGSHIVNISSMGGYQGSSKYPGMAYYSASKAALACITECLAVELKDRGISANCLALGSVQTEMFENAFPGFEASVKPAEIAGFIAYFAVNGNKFFNGKILPVAVSNP